MKKNNPIQNISERYKKAIHSKSKDIKFSTNEIGDLLAYLATLDYGISEQNKKLDKILEILEEDSEIDRF